MSIVPRPHETTHKVWQRNAFLQPWRRWKDCEHKFKSETHTFQACCTKCWTMSVWKHPTKSEPNRSENASKIAPPYSDISPKPETSAECPLTDYRAVATNQQQNLANADQKYCTFTLKSVTLPITVHGQFCKPYSVAHVKKSWLDKLLIWQFALVVIVVMVVVVVMAVNTVVDHLDEHFFLRSSCC